MRVDFIVLCFLAVDRFHVQRMSKHEWNIAFLAKVGDPVPGKDTFDADRDVRQIRLDNLHQYFEIDRRIFMKQYFAVLIDDADVHGFCVKINTAVVSMLFRIKTHLVLLFF